MKAYKIFRREPWIKDGTETHRYFSFCALPYLLLTEYFPNKWVDKKVGGIFVFKDYESVFDFCESECLFRIFYERAIPDSLRNNFSVWEVEIEDFKKAPNDILIPSSAGSFFIDCRSYWQGLQTDSHLKPCPSGTLICDRIKMTKELKIVS